LKLAGVATQTSAKISEKMSLKTVLKIKLALGLVT
jgi:hypothetical protein